MKWENLKDAQFRFITEEEYNDLTLKREQLKILGENLERCKKYLYPNFDDSQMPNNFTSWLTMLNNIQIDGAFHGYKWRKRKWDWKFITHAV